MFCVHLSLRQQSDKLEFGELHRTTTKLSLRTSDRCHWCGNPFSFLAISSLKCIRGCGLPRQCVHWLAMTYWTTQARKNRACPKDGKITTRAKARIARGGIPTNNNLSSGCIYPIVFWGLLYAEPYCIQRKSMKSGTSFSQSASRWPPSIWHTCLHTTWRCSKRRMTS